MNGRTGINSPAPFLFPEVSRRDVPAAPRAARKEASYRWFACLRNVFFMR
jgi:hypothetical protein